MRRGYTAENAIWPAVLFCMVLLFSQSGCAKKSPEETKGPGVVDYFTGAEQIRQYKKTRDKLEAIDSDLKERNRAIGE